MSTTNEIVPHAEDLPSIHQAAAIAEGELNVGGEGLRGLVAHLKKFDCQLREVDDERTALERDRDQVVSQLLKALNWVGIDAQIIRSLAEDVDRITDDVIPF